MPSASSVLRELRASAAYGDGLSFRDEPSTYVMSAHTRRMPSSIGMPVSLSLEEETFLTDYTVLQRGAPLLLVSSPRASNRWKTRIG